MFPYPTPCNCEVSRDPHPGLDNAYLLRFDFDDGNVFTRIIFDDHQTGAKIVLTNIGAEPQRKGLGTRAMKMLLAWCQEQEFTGLRVTQVQKETESFWTKLGFTPVGNSTNDFRILLI